MCNNVLPTWVTIIEYTLLYVCHRYAKCKGTQIQAFSLSDLGSIVSYIQLEYKVCYIIMEHECACYIMLSQYRIVIHVYLCHTDTAGPLVCKKNLFYVIRDNTAVIKARPRQAPTGTSAF